MTASTCRWPASPARRRAPSRRSAPERGVNNGSPSLHAGWLHALSLRDGERVAHVGAGTGYYTAILAELVGRKGRVLAIEFDPALTEAARANLADRPNVTVIEWFAPLAAPRSCSAHAAQVASLSTATSMPSRADRKSVV